MSGITFSEVAKSYDKTSIVQKSASEKLFELLSIKPTEDVLDLGCGTGDLTVKIRKITSGKVIGIDVEKEMIEKSLNKYGKKNITFKVKRAEEINYKDEFDVIFCNSAFQWFKNPDIVLQKCYEALKTKGRIGIQAPARKVYSPNFIQAIEEVKKHPKTKDVFKFFEEPWFFLESAEEYKELFERNNFEVLYAEIEEKHTKHTPEEVYNIFNSGAVAGYLNPKYYKIPIDETYAKAFREIVKENFYNQVDEEGKVELVFYRVYLIAKK
ncbi:Methyltransferase type 12 [Thermodesulfatator indicus DSM 15286]|uniref:Methyltransferase type 12 n=1 Tax=Thermodesulfatator indicus (strain DSM 15286 / JCM 11887 / CIR29812) TaxID=667014 RepID=F8A9K2_THEID|nr:methyltransferase domain-containing protein [Thermodesulfatator indicus]AEH45228.1 Methyltransferase type 12 [Thermodesulfatator indicus DSM 15286]